MSLKEASFFWLNPLLQPSSNLNWQWRHLVQWHFSLHRASHHIILRLAWCRHHFFIVRAPMIDGWTVSGCPSCDHFDGYWMRRLSQTMGFWWLYSMNPLGISHDIAIRNGCLIIHWKKGADHPRFSATRHWPRWLGVQVVSSTWRRIRLWQPVIGEMIWSTMRFFGIPGLPSFLMFLVWLK
jgi:hypothetical protein